MITCGLVRAYHDHHRPETMIMINNDHDHQRSMIMIMCRS